MIVVPHFVSSNGLQCTYYCIWNDFASTIGFSCKPLHPWSSSDSCMWCKHLIRSSNLLNATQQPRNRFVYNKTSTNKPLGAGSTAPCITPSSQKIDQLPFSLVQLDVGIQKGVLCEWHAEEEVDLQPKEQTKKRCLYWGKKKTESQVWSEISIPSCKLIIFKEN